MSSILVYLDEKTINLYCKTEEKTEIRNLAGSSLWVARVFIIQPPDIMEIIGQKRFFWA